jgi:hypothetical protein
MTLFLLFVPEGRASDAGGGSRRGLPPPEKRSRFAGVREVLRMSSRARSEVDSTAVSKAREGSASALKARVDLSLVAECRTTSSNRAHSKSARAHSKSVIDGQVLPSLSGGARARALRLARRLASSHSG